MYKTIIKIDLCNSKQFYRQQAGNIREITMHKLIDVVKKIYPTAEKKYPEGSFYSAQGDCVYLIIDKPTVAVRCTVEFMKEWYGLLDKFPDARAVIDFGDVDQLKNIERTELVGEPFEIISIIEKKYNQGQIAVTSDALRYTDDTMFQSINKKEFSITNKKKEVYEINYENPRLISDSSLVHALFIANKKSTQIRERAFEALILEFLTEENRIEINILELNHWLHQKGCPAIDETLFEKIIIQSQYLSKDNDIYKLNDNAREELNKISIKFNAEKNKAISNVAKGLSSILKLDQKIIEERVNLPSLIEEFLSAIFLEIRFMANYFKSTQSFFEKLESTSDFDYILIRYFSNIINNKPELFIFLKKEFLKLLRNNASENNIYIASIFHNVLILYYINGNPKYRNNQLSKIKNKKFFLDTNTFYAYRCKSNQYNNLLRYIISKLQKIGAEICIFDESIKEYNNALNSTLLHFNDKYGIGFYYHQKRPWIWIEYEENILAYKNNFDYCVSLHRIPQSSEKKQDFDYLEVEQHLKSIGISLYPLSPFYEKDDILEIYDDVYKAKKHFNPDTQWYELPGKEDIYHFRVLHDANCLKNLQCVGKNPYECKNLFATCDFRLSKIRYHKPNKYDFLITVSELYEFFLPYLLLSDSDSPICAKMTLDTFLH